MRYWVIKGNPKENDLDYMLEPGVVEEWHTGAPPRKWARGDRAFFWSSAPRLELVGLGQLIGPTGDFTDEDETLYEVKYLTEPLKGRVNAATLRADPICSTANFLKRSVAQGVLEVTEDQAHQMYRLLDKANAGRLRVWKDIPQQAAQVPTVTQKPVETDGNMGGQGFGEPEANRAVEQAAIQFVLKEYARRGWSVSSVEREKCGFDLDCRRGNESEHIEVKGIRGSECSFILTAGELAVARRDARFVLVAVTFALIKPTPRRIRLKELESRFSLEPIAFRARPRRDGRKA